ncbi:MAG: lysine--tRNA ligase [Candidatus Vogelbacteria bacterium CG10_big_fil_rev_8_21_14_0_10_50_13]|uniref:Lysine--tRNA ligase n=1 Tax=Candidatus Vogelbacteria bacterium CG10_big_fil_rev_8_21_14_0_10_50_13 TaxID=1975044 RepID=A0A2H0RG20_9BACT|nr:MAG: lysine--tRNA ligase [Candidatus Vogelbacteria bacterium CG10_big_fil_rev_8_21_14_0_10_50_13]
MASLEALRQERLKKLEILQTAGKEVYPAAADLTHTLGQVKSRFATLKKAGKALKLGGRVLARRGQGALIFIDFDDGFGRLQALLKKGEMANEDLELFAQTVDVGDFVAITGKLFVSKRGEKTILASSWQMLGKSLRPLPDKWDGLKDTEERFRRRYVDSLMNEEVKKRFELRSKLITELRALLDKDGFMEVETPILQPTPGGATAVPFVTHHAALDLDLYLRIAPELYLKEVLIGGFPMVYELGRSFRNEGIDASHNPEFTTIEAYAAYSSPDKEMKRVEAIFKKLAAKVLKKKNFAYQGELIDFGKKFARVTFYDLLKRYAMIANPEVASDEGLKLKASQLGVKVDKGMGREKILDGIYKKVCRPKLIQPTFIIDYPATFTPLAKRQKDNPDIIDMFQLVVGGLELVKGFAELNDPIDQRARFEEQEKRREAGDDEAQIKDESFLEAMEYGLPPTTGWGIGIDRLVMLLSDTHNIREVIYFPTLRPKE